MAKKIVFILLLSFFSAGVILILSFFSLSGDKIEENFKRNSINREPKLLKSITLPGKEFYIAGECSGQLILGNEKKPSLIHVVDLGNSAKFTHISKQIPLSNIVTGRLLIDDDLYYLLDQANKTIYSGNISDFNITKIIKDSLALDLSIPISKSSFINRVYRNHGRDYTLAKKTINDSREQVSDTILEKKMDGVLTNDGMLLFDKIGTRIVYLYFHRLQYIIADTNLNVLSRKSLVKTTGNDKVETALIKSENTLTLATPVKTLNQSSAIYQNKLFINSNVIAANDRKGLHRKFNVIDVFNIDNPADNYSFYIPMVAGEKIKNFLITKDFFIAIMGSNLFLYKIAQ